MGLRPAKCYRNKGHVQRSFTRLAVRKPRRNYIGASPALRIRQFNMGDPKKKYDQIADLKVKESFDLRDNAIESARIAINRKLVKELGKDEFFMKVRVYPSQILRENKQAQGAGADRVSQGMSLSYGAPVGRSARVRAGQVIYSVLCKKTQTEIVKDALERAKSRFSSPIYTEFHEDLTSIGTLPRKKQLEVKIEVVEEKKDGKEAAKGKEEGKEAEAKEEGKEAESKAEESKEGKK